MNTSNKTGLTGQQQTPAFKELSADARALLGFAGWFAQEPIPEYVFTGMPEYMHEACMPPALLALATDDIRWRATVAELEAHGLCQATELIWRDEQGQQRHAERCLVFDDAAQATASAASDEAWLDQQAVQALGLLCGAYPHDVHLPEHWRRCRTLMPHVRHLDQFYRDQWHEQRRYRWLLDRAAVYLRSDPEMDAKEPARALAEHLLRRAVKIAGDAFGEEDPITMTSVSNLADTLFAYGDLAGARVLQEKILEMRFRTLGEEHPDTLCAMNNLAATLWSLDDLPGARKLQEHTLEICRPVLGEQHPNTLKTMRNLAATMLCQGDISEARALQEEELDATRQQSGDEHPDTLDAMANLCATMSDQCDYPAARSLSKKILGIHRRLLGDEHPDTLRTMNNLALLMMRQGELSGARTLLKNALDIAHRIGWDENPNLVTMMNNLAVTIRDAGDMPAARAMLTKAHLLAAKVLGEQHPGTISTKNNLDALPASEEEMPKWPPESREAPCKVPQHGQRSNASKQASRTRVPQRKPGRSTY